MKTIKFIRDTDPAREGGDGYKVGDVVTLVDSSATRWINRTAAVEHPGPEMTIAGHAPSIEQSDAAKKAEEDAAAKKAEEDAAAKKAEEDADAAKKVEEDAAATRGRGHQPAVKTTGNRR